MGGSEGRRGTRSKKKRSISRSPKRHKKSSRKRSRSNSRSPLRRRSRSLSSNRKKYHSKSNSPITSIRRRSRSKSLSRRRSRTKSPVRRRSRSKSPVRRRSRSKSPVRRRSRSKSPVRRRSRSKSPARHRSPGKHHDHSRSKSIEKQFKHKDQHSHVRSQSKEKMPVSRKKENKINRDPDVNLTGFEDLLPAEQAKLRMKLALSAVVASDAPSKEQKTEDKIVFPKKSLAEQIERTKAIEAINSPEFLQQSFKSKQDDKDCQKKDLHSEAMFGDVKLDSLEVKIVQQPTSSDFCLAHPNLFEDLTIKKERWCQKLNAMRQNKLSGEKIFWLVK